MEGQEIPPQSPSMLARRFHKSFTPSSHASTQSSVRHHRASDPDPESAENPECAEAELFTCRHKVQKCLANTYVDTALSTVIIFNVVLMIVETNHKAFCLDREGGECDESSTKSLALWWSNTAFQIVYTIECAVRLYAYRCEFFQNKGNLLDISIVILGYADMILVEALSGKEIPGPGVAILRIFRIARLLRVARILRFFPELYMMIRGFMGAMMAMFWGMFMIACLLLIWSILGVELIHPTSKGFKDEEGIEHCAEAFSSVEACMLIFFQTVFAGDSWGSCSMPIIKASPELFFIFAGTLITIQLGFTNLVLAVIVERATKSAEQDTESRAKEKVKVHEEARERLGNLIGDIDEDKNGTISWEELRKAYQNKPELVKVLTLMDIHEIDLENMFTLLSDDAGNVDYWDLVDHLERCESEDLRRDIMLMSLYLARIREDVLQMTRESKAQMRHTETGISSPLLDMQAQLQAVRQEVRGHIEETFQGLETSLQAQRSSLEHHVTKQVRVQLATLSQHTDMLMGIAVAIGSKVVEPKDIEETNSEVEPSKSRGSLFDNLDERPGKIEPGSLLVGAEGTRKKKISKYYQRKGEASSRDVALWRDKPAPSAKWNRDRQG